MQLEPKFYNAPLAQAIREYAASGRKDETEIKVEPIDPWWVVLPDGHFSDDGELYVTVWRGRKGGLSADIIDSDDIAAICAPAGQ
jgi:hypothetical protein